MFGPASGFARRGAGPVPRASGKVTAMASEEGTMRMKDWVIGVIGGSGLYDLDGLTDRTAASDHAAIWVELEL